MSDALAVFEKNTPAHLGQGTHVEQARAIAEVRAAVMIAMDRPRHTPTAIREMREVCQIDRLADRAFFRVSRGSEQVSGESIHLARELARCWGNIDYGVKELVRDDVRGQSEMLAFAWDLQTNARSELTFIIPHMRHTKKGEWKLKGTQEIYENNASFAGRRLRECIFSVLPVWFRAEAADICRHTLEHGGGKPLAQRIADLIASFAKMGVSRVQLETKTRRKTDDFLPEDVANLGVVYKSIQRNEVTKDDEFPPETGAGEKPAGGKLDALEAKTEKVKPQIAKEDEPPLTSEAVAALILDTDEAAGNEATLKAIEQHPQNRETVRSATPDEAKQIEAAYAAARR